MNSRYRPEGGSTPDWGKREVAEILSNRVCFGTGGAARKLVNKLGCLFLIL